MYLIWVEDTHAAIVPGEECIALPSSSLSAATQLENSSWLSSQKLHKVKQDIYY